MHGSEFPHRPSRKASPNRRKPDQLELEALEPAPVSAFGRDGYHVITEVPETCDGATGALRNIFLRPGEVMESWIFDMGGQILIVEANWDAESPEKDLAELRAVIDTLVLTP